MSSYNNRNRRRGGGCKSFLTFIIGMFMGIVLFVGSIAGTVYYFVGVATIGEIQDMFSLDLIDKENEVNDTTLLSWGKKAFDILSNYETVTINQLQEKLGINFIPTDVYGIDISVLFDTPLLEIPNNLDVLLNSLTLAFVQEKFSLELPDLPILDEYMDTPLLDAVNEIMGSFSMDSLTLRYIEDSFGLDLGVDMLNALKDTALSSIGDKVNTLRLSDFLPIDCDVFVKAGLNTVYVDAGYVEQTADYEWGESETRYAYDTETAKYRVSASGNYKYVGFTEYSATDYAEEAAYPRYVRGYYNILDSENHYINADYVRLSSLYADEYKAVNLSSLTITDNSVTLPADFYYEQPANGDTPAAVRAAERYQSQPEDRMTPLATGDYHLVHVGTDMAALQSLSQLTVADLTNAGETVMELTIGELIEIDDDSIALLKSIKDLKISEIEGKISTFKLYELMDIDKDEYTAMTAAEIASSDEDFEFYAFDDVNGRFVAKTKAEATAMVSAEPAQTVYRIADDVYTAVEADATLSDGVDYYRLEGSNYVKYADKTAAQVDLIGGTAVYTCDKAIGSDQGILKMMAYMTVDQLMNVDDLFDDVKIGDVITVDESSPAILKSLANKKISELTDGFDDLKLYEILDIDKDEYVAMSAAEVASSDEDFEFYAFDEDGGKYVLKNKAEAIAMVSAEPAQTVYRIADDVYTAVEAGTTLSDGVDYYDTAHVKYADKATAQDALDGGATVYTCDTGVGTDNAILKKMAYKKISQLTDFDNLLDDVKLGEVITIDDSSPAVLKTLADKNIGELSTVFDDIRLYEILEIDKDEYTAMSAAEVASSGEDFVFYAFDEDGGKYVKKTKAEATAMVSAEPAQNVYRIADDVYTAVEAGTTLSDGVDYYDAAHVKYADKATAQDALDGGATVYTCDTGVGNDNAVLKQMAYMKINQLSNVESLFDEVKFGDVIEIDENSPEIFKALADITVGGLSDEINFISLYKMISIDKDEYVKADAFEAAVEYFTFDAEKGSYQSDDTVSALSDFAAKEYYTKSTDRYVKATAYNADTVYYEWDAIGGEYKKTTDTFSASTDFGGVVIYRLADDVYTAVEAGATLDDGVDYYDTAHVKYADTATAQIALNGGATVYTCDKAVGTSNGVLKKMAYMTLKQLENMDDAISDVTLGEVMTITEDDARILVALKDTKVGDLGTKVDTLKLSEIMDIYENDVPDPLNPGTNLHDKSAQILIALSDSTLTSISTDMETLQLYQMIDIDKDEYTIVTAEDVLAASADDVFYTFDSAKGVFEAKTKTELTDPSAPDIGTIDVYEMTTVGTSNAILKKLAYKSTSQMSDLDGIADDIELGEFIEVQADSPEILKALEHTKIGDMSERINTLTLGEVLTIDASSPKVLRTLESSTVNNLGDDMNNLMMYQVIDIDTMDEFEAVDLAYINASAADAKFYAWDETNGVYSEMTKADALAAATAEPAETVYRMSVEGTANVILKKIAYKKLNQMSSMDGLVDDVALGDLITIDPTSPKILQALADTTVGSMSERVDTLTLGEVLDITEDSPAMLKTLKDCRITEFGDEINNLLLYQIIDIDKDEYRKANSFTVGENYYAWNAEKGFYEKQDGVTALTAFDGVSYYVKGANGYLAATAYTAGTSYYVWDSEECAYTLTEDVSAGTDFNAVTYYVIPTECYVKLTARPSDDTKTYSYRDGANMEEFASLAQAQAAYDAETAVYVTKSGTGTSEPVLKKMAYMNTSQFDYIGDVIDTLALSDMIDIYETAGMDGNGVYHDKSPQMLIALKDTTVGTLPQKVQNLRMSEVIEIDPATSPKVLISLQDCKITELSDEMSNLKMYQVIDIDTMDEYSKSGISKSYIQTHPDEGYYGFDSDKGVFYKCADSAAAEALLDANKDAYILVSEGSANVILKKIAYKKLSQMSDMEGLLDDVSLGELLDVVEVDQVEIDPTGDRYFVSAKSDDYYYRQASGESGAYYLSGGNYVEMDSSYVSGATYDRLPIVYVKDSGGNYYYGNIYTQISGAPSDPDATYFSQNTGVGRVFYTYGEATIAYNLNNALKFYTVTGQKFMTINSDYGATHRNQASVTQADTASTVKYSMEYVRTVEVVDGGIPTPMDGYIMTAAELDDTYYSSATSGLQAGEYVRVTQTEIRSSGILTSLAASSIGGMSDAISNMTVGDVVDSEPGSFLDSMSTVKITEMQDEVKTRIQTGTISQMNTWFGLGVADIVLNGPNGNDGIGGLTLMQLFQNITYEDGKFVITTP